jgi:hypothetical protein
VNLRKLGFEVRQGVLYHGEAMYVIRIMRGKS